MNKIEFKIKLKNMGLTQKEFAKMTGYGYSTVKSWDITPRWVPILLEHMEIVSSFLQVDKSLENINILNKEISIKVQNSNLLKIKGI